MWGFKLEVADIVAYIGAAAWVPQIIGWVIQAFSKPKVRLLPDRALSVGFTSFGPIFNLHIAFASERKDALLEELSVHLSHEAGDTRHLSWVSHAEAYQVLGSDNSVQQTVKRELPPVALKVGTDALVEKQVRFQDQEFIEQKAAVLAIADKKILHARKHNNFSPDDFLLSPEVSDLYQIYENFCWWRQGQYSLEFSIKSPNGASLFKQRYSFALTNEDVQRLKSNLQVARVEMRNIIFSAQEGFNTEPVIWHWCDPKMTRLM